LSGKPRTHGRGNPASPRQNRIAPAKPHRPEHDVAALRTERDLDGVGENIDASNHAFASGIAELDFFSSHFLLQKFELMNSL
jgi:hypothetical protein